MDTNEMNIKELNIDFTVKKKRKKKNREQIEENEKPPKKEKQKRVITQTTKWMFSDMDLSNEKQMEYIETIYNKTTETNTNATKIIIQQINQKIYGYKIQDIDKNIYNETEFIPIENVINKLMECKNTCFYCKNPVLVLYEYVREPKQWSLERINNNYGHNTDNVVISCLNCNLHRRTMYHERYLFTKQLSIQKV